MLVRNDWFFPDWTIPWRIFLIELCFDWTTHWLNHSSDEFFFEWTFLWLKHSLIEDFVDWRDSFFWTLLWLWLKYSLSEPFLQWSILRLSCSSTEPFLDRFALIGPVLDWTNPWLDRWIISWLNCSLAELLNWTFFELNYIYFVDRRMPNWIILWLKYSLAALFPDWLYLDWTIPWVKYSLAEMFLGWAVPRVFYFFSLIELFLDWTSFSLSYSIDFIYFFHEWRLPLVVKFVIQNFAPNFLW